MFSFPNNKYLRNVSLSMKFSLPNHYHLNPWSSHSGTAMKLRERMLDMLGLEHRGGWHASTCTWVSQGGPASVVQGFRDPLGLRRHCSHSPAGRGICVFHTSFAHKINFPPIFFVGTGVFPVIFVLREVSLTKKH